MSSTSHNNPNVSPLDQLAEQFLEALRRGESVTIDDFAERNPKLADQIRELFPTLEMLEDLKSPAIEGGAVTGNGRHSSRQPELSDYRIVREIARGGMGIVYEAEQISLGRTVALKVLSADAEHDEVARERFRSEARSAARLHHTNIVSVFEVGCERHTDFYAMQFIDGKALDRVIQEVQALLAGHVTEPESGTQISEVAHILVGKTLASAQIVKQRIGGQDVVNGNDDSQAGGAASSRSGSDTARPAFNDTAVHAKFDQSTLIDLTGGSQRVFRNYCDRVARIGADVAGALQCAHNHGILHRDIKPANLLLDTNGTIWIADFGLAKSEDLDLTQTGAVVGTLRYMAPERFDGTADVCGDVYALGMTLYEMLARRPGFEGLDQLSLLEKIRQDDPMPLGRIDSRIPRDLQTIVHKAIAREPARRYASAQLLADDLTRFVNGQPIRARYVQLHERFAIWVRRSPLVASLMMLLVGGSLLTAAGAFYSAVTFRTLAIENGDLLTKARRAEASATVSAGEAEAQARINEERLYFAEMRQAGEMCRTPTGYRGVALHLNEWLPGERDLRGWEWYWLKSATNTEEEVIASKEFRDMDFCAATESMAYSREGRIVVRDLNDGTTREYSGGLHGPITSLRFNSSGNMLAVSSRLGHSAAVLDLATGQFVRRQSFGGRECGEVRWSPGERTLALVAKDENEETCLYLWDIATGEERRIADASLSFHAIDYSPDGDLLAVSVVSGGACLYDTKSWERTTLTRQRVFSDIKWHPNGSVVALVHARVVEFRKRDGSSGGALKNPARDSLICCSWHPSGRFIATLGIAQGVKVWTFPNRELVREFGGLANNGIAVSWLPDGRRVAATSHANLRIWDVAALNPMHTIVGPSHKSWLNNWRFNWTSNDDFEVTGKRSSMTVSASQLSPDLIRLRSGTKIGRPLFCRSIDGRVAFNAVSGRVTVKVEGEDGQNAAPELNFQHESPINHLAWNPRRPELAILASEDLWLWNPDESSRPVRIRSPHRELHAIEWSPDGSALAIGEYGGFLIRRSEQSQFVRTNSSIHDLAWSPDGSRIVATGKGPFAAIFDARTHEILLELIGHTSAIRGVSWSPDARRIATASDDNTVGIWDAASGQHTLTLYHPDIVFSVGWSPDGRKLASFGRDEVIRVWDASHAYEAAIDPPNALPHEGSANPPMRPLE